MRIGTNISAYMAGAQLSKVEICVSRSMQRMSSGYKITSSKDDPAGMAISHKLRTQINELKRSGMNASDGVSVVTSAESSLAEVESMVQRMRELAVQGASDTCTDEDRKNLMSEVSQLQDEIDRISTDTQFNNINILDGSFGRCTYAFDANDRMTTDVGVLYISENVPVGEYEITVSGGKIDVDEANIQKVFGKNAIAAVDGNKVDITGDNGFEISFSVNKVTTPDQTFTIEISELGGMPIQVGNNEGQDINIIIPRVSTDVLHIDDLDLTTVEGCDKAITKLDTAVSIVSKIRSSLGGYQNRLDSSVSTIASYTDSLTAAMTTISSVDIAQEMTEYTSQTVLQQAGITMLSQANQMPEKILQLLQ